MGLLTAAILAIGLAVIWALVTGREQLVVYAFLMRVQIASALVLALAPPVISLADQPMLANLFVIEDALGLFVATCLSLLGSFACGASVLLTYEHAPRRYSLDPLPLASFFRRENAWRLLPFAALALPLQGVLIARADLEGMDVLVPVLAGDLLALAGLLVVEVLRNGAVPRFQAGLRRVLTRERLATWPSVLGSGYVDGKRGELLPGHGTAVAGLLFFGALYVVGYFGLEPARRSVELPPLAYLLLIFALVSSFLSGLTFFFDRLRVPLFLLLGCGSWLVFATRDADHTFNVYDGLTVEPAAVAEPVESWSEALRGRDLPEQRAMVVVCASGGGIQASAWTVEVLAGLEETLHESFVPSIRFVSATSGGSVGMMHFLEAYPEGARAPRLEDLDTIREAAARSSLAATGWGLAYPDLMRAALPFNLVDPRVDRASVMEDAWARTIGKRTRLSEWVRRARLGELPGVVFNSTLVETGERLLLSTVEVPRATDTRTFLELYGGRDVDVVTAARLSATFPYVSPVARGRLEPPDPRVELPPVHVADGGYFDNFGVYAAVEWLRGLLDEANASDASVGSPLEGIDRIVFLEIRAFPPGPAFASESPGWLWAVGGPVSAVLRTRSATQLARNDTELSLLQELHPGLIERIVIAPPRDIGSERVSPPLSWHLTCEEREQVKDAWDVVVQGPEVEELRGIFGSRSER